MAPRPTAQVGPPALEGVGGDTGDVAGCLALLALAGAAALIWLGRPAAFVALVAFVCWAILKAVRSELGKADPAQSDLRARILSGSLGAAQSVSLWLALGTAGVWLLQLALLAGLRLRPDGAAALELAAADAAMGLKSLVTLPRTLAAIGVATLAALLIDRVWPLTALGLARKTATILVAALGAFAAFSFVGVQSGAARYDSASAPIRARIAADLDALRLARQQGAAFRWATAMVDAERMRTPQAGRSWGAYLELGEFFCRIEQERYAQSYGDGSSPRFRTYCDPDDFLTRLVRARLSDAGTKLDGGDPVAWVGEFRSEARPGDSLLIPPPDYPILAAFPDQQAFEPVAPELRLSILRALQARVASRLNDAEKARDTARGALSKTATAMLAGFAPDLAEGLAGKLTDALLDIVVKEGTAAVAQRLRLESRPLSATARALLAIEPVTLDSPAHASRTPSTLRESLSAVWNSAFPLPPASPELQAFARREAVRAHQADETETAERKRMAEQMEALRRKAEVERARTHVK